jgi:hypothetical protein
LKSNSKSAKQPSAAFAAYMKHSGGNLNANSYFKKIARGCPLVKNNDLQMPYKCKQ